MTHLPAATPILPATADPGTRSVTVGWLAERLTPATERARWVVALWEVAPLDARRGGYAEDHRVVGMKFGDATITVRHRGRVVYGLTRVYVAPENGRTLPPWLVHYTRTLDARYVGDDEVISVEGME